MPSTRINASSYMPVSTQIPNNKTRFRATSPPESTKTSAEASPVRVPEKSQVASVIAPPIKPTANNAPDTNCILLRCCTLFVQRLRALGAANPTPARASNASTVSCMNACAKSPADITLIAANDANSTAMNATTVFPFRTSAHHPPHTKKVDGSRPRAATGQPLTTKTPRYRQLTDCSQNPAKPATRCPQSKKAGTFRHRPLVLHSVYSNAALTARAPSSELPRGGG